VRGRWSSLSRGHRWAIVITAIAVFVVAFDIVAYVWEPLVRRAGSANPCADVTPAVVVVLVGALGLVFGFAAILVWGVSMEIVAAVRKRRSRKTRMSHIQETLDDRTADGAVWNASTGVWEIRVASERTRAAAIAKAMTNGDTPADREKRPWSNPRSAVGWAILALLMACTAVWVPMGRWHVQDVSCPASVTRQR